MSIENIRKEYETQDNRATAYPLYVEVQELTRIGVINTDYWYTSDSEIYYEDLRNCKSEDCSEDCYECCHNSFDYCTQKDEKSVLYLWICVEVFLTVKSANKWIELNAHNHGKLRTYIKPFHRDNLEIREVLKEAGLKVE